VFPHGHFLTPLSEPDVQLSLHPALRESAFLIGIAVPNLSSIPFQSSSRLHRSLCQDLVSIRLLTLWRPSPRGWLSQPPSTMAPPKRLIHDY
jgi:hypothetical protein